MSYYDSRKNQYISVPSTSTRYFTDNDPIEAFDGNLGGEEAPPVTEEVPLQDNTGFISYDPTESKFIIDEPKEDIQAVMDPILNKESFSNRKIKGLDRQSKKKILKEGNMEHFDNPPNVTVSNGGTENPTAEDYCHEGYNLASIEGSDASAALQKCSNEYKDRCVGVVVQQDFPAPGKSTCFLKSRFSGQQGTSKNAKCKTHYIGGGATVQDPISNLTKSDGRLGNILNPALPGSSSGQYDSLVAGNTSTMQVPQSIINEQRVPQRDCSWSWDSKCIPDDVSYYSNTQVPNNSPVLPLPDSCMDTGLNPHKPQLIKGSDETQYIYVDGRKMALPVGPGKSCYAAKYWIDSNTRNQCSGTGDDGQTTTCPDDIPSNALDLGNNQTCFNDIPTIPGNNPNGSGEIECQSDLRPSQRAEISNSLSSEANKYSTRGRKASLLYNTKSAIVASKYGEMSKANNLLSKQVDSSQTNSLKLDKLDSSIYSQQRQVQISNDETRRKNENLFLLKLLFTYLLVIAIPLLIKKSFGDNFKNSHVLLIIIFITIPFIYILGWNLYSIRNRSPMRWPLRNWPTGPLPDETEGPNEETAPTCPPPAQEVAQCQEEAQLLEEEIINVGRQKQDLQNEDEKLNERQGNLEDRLCAAKQCIPGQSCNNNSITFSI